MIFREIGHPITHGYAFLARARVNVGGRTKDCHSVVPHPSLSCLKSFAAALNVILNLIRLTLYQTKTTSA